jgi:hypothetical protein
MMMEASFENIFAQDVLENLFPKDRADRFFDALYGDTAEGTYDIDLEFKEHSQNKLLFELHLKQRYGKCLRCNLTYGLPEVFTRHPIIDIKGLVQNIGNLLNGRADCVDWHLGDTREVSGELHVIPLIISLKD